MRIALAALLLAACTPKDSESVPSGTTRDTACHEPEVAPPPHVVLILLDDVGWTGLSGGQTSAGLGSDYHETPRIDALADQSVAFSAAYASPQCQPTRAALLTGQASTRTRLYANFDSNRADPDLRVYDAPPTRSRLPLDAETLAEMLAPAGWRTASFGKWHIGEDGIDGPAEQGFGLNVGGTDAGNITGGSDGHLARSDGSFDLPNLGANGVAGQFVADRLTDEALAWMGADLETPSFTYLSHFSVHTPIQSPPEDQALFDGKAAGTWHSEPTYAGMLHNLDANVGRVVDWLEQTDDPRTCGKLIENTLLVVLSDNGASGGYEADEIPFEREVSNQKPLKSGKGAAWEGGVRVPMLIRWDRGGQAGRIVPEPVQHVDVVPTVLDLTGVSAAPWTLDGASLRPVFTSTDPPPDRPIFLHYPAYLDFQEEGGTHALRESPVSVAWEDRYKLLWRYDTGAWELYDLQADLSETSNIAGAQPALVQDLGTRLVSWLVETEADLPRIKDTDTPVALPDPQGLP